MRKKYTISALSIVIVTVIFISISRSAFSLTFQTSQDILFTFRPMLSLSISGDLTINELTPGTYQDSNESTITVESNAEKGIYLAASVGTNNINGELHNQDDWLYSFSSLSTTASLPSMANANNNTWGYSYNLGEGYTNYSGLPWEAYGESKVLIDTDSVVGHKDILFKIAAKASNSQPAGTYTNVINFYAVTKPIIEPKTINDLEYMQEFKTLSSGEKATVLASMTLNQQYQLKDQRDNKEYYIARLADGNVWMTQNLDHDIVTTTGFYTSENTDLDLPDGLNFTMNTATYATNDTTWNSSDTTPESYDPGNLCWNGNFRFDDYGTLATMTVPCTDSNANKHYSIGNYYNWTAAVAMNDSSDYTTNQQDVDQSICPAGWRLPTTTENNYNKSYQNLVTSLRLTAGQSGNIHNSPVYFAYGGVWYDDSADFYGGSLSVGYNGSYWSSVVRNHVKSYRLYIKVSLFPKDEIDRTYGYSVRCVAK